MTLRPTVPMGSPNLVIVAAIALDTFVKERVNADAASERDSACDAAGLPAAQLLAAKGSRPIRSLDDLAADPFESDEELEDFLAFTCAERYRDLA